MHTKRFHPGDNSAQLIHQSDIDRVKHQTSENNAALDNGECLQSHLINNEELRQQYEINNVEP